MIHQTSFITAVKTEIAIDLLQTMEPAEGYYLANSGGKDSAVIHQLAIEANVRFDAHHNITTADPPELIRHLKTYYPDTHMDPPSLTMWRLIPKKRMPPTRLVRYCCSELKERGGSGRVVMTGIRRQESNARKKRRQIENCFRDSSKTYIHPIIDWTEDEVWTFLADRNITTCSLYRDGFTRLGCIMCPMQGTKGMVRDSKRWPTYYHAYLRAFDNMLIGRRKAGLKTTWKYPEEVMDWWLFAQ